MKYDGRTGQVIASSLGQLIGQVKKGTRHRRDSNHTYYAGEGLPEIDKTGGEWYAKMDVIGIPGLKQQKGRGTPCVVVQTPSSNDATAGPGYFTADHYGSFKLLTGDFFQAAACWIAFYSK